MKSGGVAGVPESDILGHGIRELKIGAASAIGATNPTGFIPDAPVGLFAFVLADSSLPWCSASAVVRSVPNSTIGLPLAGLTAVSSGLRCADDQLSGREPAPVSTCSVGHLLRSWWGRGAGMLVVTVILVVQALPFRRGGLTALGIGVLNM